MSDNANWVSGPSSMTYICLFGINFGINFGKNKRRKEIQHLRNKNLPELEEGQMKKQRIVENHRHYCLIHQSGLVHPMNYFEGGRLPFEKTFPYGCVS